MSLHRLILVLTLALCATGALADTLGVGRLFNNDRIGDGQDRWRSGSYMVSIITGAGWTGRAPQRPGQLLEYRLRSEIISPADPTGHHPADRPYVGGLSAGVHSHWTQGLWDLRAGMDITAIGPSTGVRRFHETSHDLLSLPRLRVDGAEHENAVFLGLNAEAARPLRLGGAQLRPFAELQTGPETMARLGADLFVGPGAGADLLTRDPVTGHLLRAIEGPSHGLAMTLGADWAHIWDSAYLPAPIMAQDHRLRARAGLHWQIADGMSFFYGATWLSPEYQGQEDGQVLGSLKVNFNF